MSHIAVAVQGTAAAPAGPSVVSLSGITKSFGPTLANAGIDLSVRAGDVIGLVGGNGAGKSTLMRILCGAMWPTLGAISFAGEEVPFAAYNTGEAQRRGIRMVHQELSLCANLSVAENFFLETPGDSASRPGWRALYRTRARAALDAVFPGNGIDADTEVGHLTIAERQMVEIARAAATPSVTLIVLDEPTSSLDLDRSKQLRAFVRGRAKAGLAFIFISHKLQEIIDIATEVVVLRNGRMAWQGHASNASIGKLVQLMGGDANPIHQHSVAAASSQDVLVRLSGALTSELGRDLDIVRGEIVGLAGLEGSGQKDLLHAIFKPDRKQQATVARYAEAGFIAGDRQKEGVFPLWSVLSNISIGALARRSALGVVSERANSDTAKGAASKLRLDDTRFQSNITELSGGNQQKALVARALVADTPIILLDDPTRGVDIATKQDFYRLCNEVARGGRALIWHTTEDAELLACDRVLVFSGGRIVSELAGEAITEQAIVGASFAQPAAGQSNTPSKRTVMAGLGRKLVNAAPFIGLAAVLAIMIAINPAVASTFGLDLLLMPALSLVLVTAAQMFIVGGSEIDLGVGAFAGLVSVLSATLLYDQPWLGTLALVAALAAYAGLGGVIQARKIPAIVVTLGASFIWVGIGYALQPTPGGASPDWLITLFGWSIGFMPTSIIMIATVALIVLAIDRLPLGVVLRGFGNNPAAMIRSGWSPTRYALVRYLIAGLFAGAAGLSLTAINTASDINSGNSFTLLSVAAVVMGGCSLLGGIISPVGAVAGAVTLSLIGALLGTLSVSSDYNAATQGLILIALLTLRSLTADRRSES
ncbi:MULTISPECIES: ATP-binding cassette domain-containing protein [unclassified Mesorhizobium]|uniref:ATP-binding cassette domain-containing protein n=1 Tax=unclassified Mesorhizobium TaxID=325217 RepID=UPI001CCDDD85|nr:MULTISPECIES: ATP-binding cassette domain-containing protein [unclassified Mesorhizobium]MBZ9734530.1 ATP-binding cassette domain-containing protein [Mesorhizobium sp. CA9]MBZ9826934.1 ATP-binding cassette domain-containing protein [Mesorhizobium sp. CA18]MBZ9832444.1 ATP-binding cassette domain-containing protein [Mesorhizobium sp. CA2]MBZ9838500.1 ATP-binding cassette domain-containing protein [Mesorhizobium sp. CA3]MBZ9878907.1 ATP-binding cassette domain-containing protein [Mesorhizobiu